MGLPACVEVASLRASSGGDERISRREGGREGGGGRAVGKRIVECLVLTVLSNFDQH